MVLARRRPLGRSFGLPRLATFTGTIGFDSPQRVEDHALYALDPEAIDDLLATFAGWGEGDGIGLAMGAEEADLLRCRQSELPSDEQPVDEHGCLPLGLDHFAFDSELT